MKRKQVDIMAWEITNITFAKIVELDLSEETFELVTKLAEEMGMKFDDCLRYLMKKDIEVTKLAEETGMKFDDCLRYINDIEEHRKEKEH